MNYISEISSLQTFDNNNGQVSTRCGYGIFSCIFSGAVSGAIIGATAAGVVGGPVGIGAGIIVGFSIGGVAGFGLYVFEGNYGTCDNCEELDCNPVMGVSLTFPTCTSAIYTAFGFGQDLNSTIAWTNVSGTPLTTTTTTAVPRTTIMQNSSSVPVVTTITATCTDGDNTTAVPSLPFTRDLSSLALEVLGLTLYGEAHVLPGNTEYYTVHGYNNNSNYTTEWFVNNGTIISSTNTSAQIQWDAGLTTGWVQAQVFNNCPGGYSKTFTFNVAGDSTDIP